MPMQPVTEGIVRLGASMAENQIPSIVETLMDRDAAAARAYLEILDVLKDYERSNTLAKSA